METLTKNYSGIPQGKDAVPPNCCEGSYTSNECMSELSSGDECSRDDHDRHVRKIPRRQGMFIPILDVHCNTHSAPRQPTPFRPERIACSTDAEEFSALAGAMTTSCMMRDRLSISIPKSVFYVFPSDLPKHAIVECIQGVFDSIAPAFHSRYDRDKRSWAVYSSYPPQATRFNVHIYDFDGITHVEMRTECGSDEHGSVVFRMLQSVVGRCSPGSHGPPLDSFYDTISMYVPPNERVPDREFRRSLKSAQRAIQTGSAVELEDTCVMLLQHAAHSDTHDMLSECVPALLERIVSDDIISKLEDPIESPVSKISGMKLKGSRRIGRQQGYCVLPGSEWNAFVKASDLLRRLSCNAASQDKIFQNSQIISYLANFITASLGVEKAFLIRRNFSVVFENLTHDYAEEVVLAGVKEAMCTGWVAPVAESLASKDPLFLSHVRTVMQNLGVTLPDL